MSSEICVNQGWIRTDSVPPKYAELERTKFGKHLLFLFIRRADEVIVSEISSVAADNPQNYYCRQNPPTSATFFGSVHDLSRNWALFFHGLNSNSMEKVP